MNEVILARIGALAVLAYLLGSIPFGLLVGLAKGVDIRAGGSCNIGATNAGRLLGKRYFYLVMVLDALKGLAPTVMMRQVLAGEGLLAERLALASGLWLLVGFAAVAGHNWPVYLRFRGGKGVATSLGVALGVYPYYTYPGLAALAVWLAVVAATRYVSLGSMSAAVGFVVSYAAMVQVNRWQWSQHWVLMGFAVAMAGVLIWRHRANIVRLKAGMEGKF